VARLGASITDYLGPTDLDTYIRECVDRGFRAAPSPAVDLDDQDAIRHTRDEFQKADILLAETAAWVNPLDPDPVLRSKARADIARALALADELGAACCTTVSGSFASSDTPDSHVGHHPDNFTPEALGAVVEWVREVLRDVQPKRSYLTLEMCPWAVVDGPEVYRKLLEIVDNPRLAVHLDPANSMSSPRALFQSAGVIRDLFEQLGPWVKSCHAKDVAFFGNPAVVALKEVPPVTGYMDYRQFLRCIGSLGTDMPLIMEHLPDRESYVASAERIRVVAELEQVHL
jgi:sugar phosphate isomerase/epimerase